MEKNSKSKGTILVVDDEERARILLQRILEDADYNVVMASSGDEAFAKLSSSDVSLVLLDIKMPGINGYETLKLIREKSGIPVIMVTALGGVDSKFTSFELGADDYIKKPFRSGELIARIEAKLRRRRN